MTPRMSLPISTTIVCELLKSLTLYDDIKCITVNGQTIIHVGANKMSRNHNSFRTKKYLGSAQSLFMRSSNFELCHMAAQASRLYGFTKVIKFIVCIKKLLCKTCLYADYSYITIYIGALQLLVVLKFFVQWQAHSQW